MSRDRQHEVGSVAWRRTARSLLCVVLFLGSVPAGHAVQEEQRAEEETEAKATLVQFPERTFRLYSHRDVGLRLRPDAGLRLEPLRPRFSPVVPDFDDRERRTGPLFSLATDLTILGIDSARDSAKGQEFRDLTRGAVFGLDGQYRNEQTWFRLTGRHLLRDDRDVLFELRQFDVLTAHLSWSAIPHNYAFGATSLYDGVGSGRLTLDDGVQELLQGSTTLGDAADRIAGVLAFQGRRVDLGHTRNRFALELDFTLFDPLAIEATYKEESREGVRPWSGAFSLANVVEIPWPVDYDTEDGSISLEWARGKTLVRGSFRRADFGNDISTVAFDNPWRISDSTGSITSSFAAGPAHGLIDLYPDNRQEEQTLTFIRRQMPGDGTLAATVVWGKMSQNDPLVPYTTNTALLPGTAGNPPFDASDPANVPAASANARLDTRLLHLRYTVAPLDFFEIRLELRDYELDNETSQIFIPGFALEDSVWYPFLGPAGGAYTNNPIAFATTSIELELGFDLGARTRLKLSFENEEYDREFREVERTDEESYTLALDTKPARWVDLRASFLHSEREAEEYDFDQFFTNQGMTFIPALPFLVKFDQATRDRDRLQLIASFYPSGSLIVGVQVIDGSDEFPDSPFGVQADDHQIYAVDASYVFGERATLFSSYSHERYEMRIAGRQWDFGGPGDPFNLEPGLESASNWTADTRDDIDTVTFGIDVSLLPERLHFDVAYSYSKSDGRLDYASPVGSFDANPFVPADFEEVDDVDFYSFNPRLRLKLDEHKTVSVGYMKEKYDLVDFATEGFRFVPTTPAGEFNGALFQNSFPFDFDLEAVYVQIELSF